MYMLICKYFIRVQKETYGFIFICTIYIYTNSIMVNKPFFLVSVKTGMILNYVPPPMTEVVFDRTIKSQGSLWYLGENRDGVSKNVVSYTGHLTIGFDPDRPVLHANANNAYSLVQVRQGEYVLTYNEYFVTDSVLTSKTDPAFFRRVYPDDFFGCLHTESSYRTTSSSNFIEEGLSLITEIGLGIVKVSFDNLDTAYTDIPEHDSSDIRSVIENVFRGSFKDYHTIILSIEKTIGVPGLPRIFQDGDDEFKENLKLETLFFRELTQYLESTFVNKTFVLETPSIMFSSYFSDTGEGGAGSIDKMSDLIKSRQLGVSSGRRSSPNKNVTKVLYSIEIVGNPNSVSSKDILLGVLEKTDVDIVGYSISGYRFNGDLLSEHLGIVESHIPTISSGDDTPSSYIEKLSRIDERFSKRVYLIYGSLIGTYETNLIDDQITLSSALSWGCTFAIYDRLIVRKISSILNRGVNNGLIVSLDEPVEWINTSVKKSDMAQWLTSVTFSHIPVRRLGEIKEETIEREKGASQHVSIISRQSKNKHDLLDKHSAHIRDIERKIAQSENKIRGYVKIDTTPGYPYLLDAIAVDIITFEEISVRDYLSENSNNMVIFDTNGKPHFTNSDDLEILIDDSSIVYGCVEANEMLFQNDSNVELDQELFNARRMGTLGGYLNADDLRYAMGEKDGSRMFGISKSIKDIPAIISKASYGGGSLVSANHCQVGAEGSYHKIFSIIM